MTPKEKAEELVSKYEVCTRPIFTLLQYEVEKVYNKQCALIAVDEIIDQSEDANFGGYKMYWQEVKNEIEKI